MTDTTDRRRYAQPSDYKSAYAEYVARVVGDDGRDVSREEFLERRELSELADCE